MESFNPASTSPPIPPNSELSLLRDDTSGLTVVLTAHDNTNYEIRFPRRLAYQVTDEGDRLRSMVYLDGRAATPIGRIENSKWKAWFVEETLEIRAAHSLIHWCIVTPNDIVDVIAEEAPTVALSASHAQQTTQYGWLRRLWLRR